MPLGGLKQRAVLAILLINRNSVRLGRSAHRPALGRVPPATVAKSLQVHVSNLRKKLGAEAIVTRGGGYLLPVEPGGVDVDRFDDLVARGREELASGDPARAAELLTEARALRRGPPLADLSYEEFARREIERLDESYEAALEEWIDAELDLGRHVALIPELESLVAAHPAREGLRRRLMLALYRSGRQAEALEVYRREATASARSSASSRAETSRTSKPRSSLRTRRSTHLDGRHGMPCLDAFRSSCCWPAASRCSRRPWSP